MRAWAWSGGVATMSKPAPSGRPAGTMRLRVRVLSSASRVRRLVRRSAVVEPLGLRIAQVNEDDDVALEVAAQLGPHLPAADLQVVEPDLPGSAAEERAKAATWQATRACWSHLSTGAHHLLLALSHAPSDAIGGEDSGTRCSQPSRVNGGPPGDNSAASSGRHDPRHPQAPLAS
jgi:hypothetical protein